MINQWLIFDSLVVFGVLKGMNILDRDLIVQRDFLFKKVENLVTPKSHEIYCICANPLYWVFLGFDKVGWKLEISIARNLEA